MLIKKSQSAIVIGDIAGQYDAFIRLIARFPGRDIISVGDIIDRGPKSSDVVSWFMSNANLPNNLNAICIRGNHEDMMIKGLLYNQEDNHGDWIFNGGMQTLKSYNNVVPDDHLRFLDACPKSVLIEIGADKFFVSHAPYPALNMGFPNKQTEDSAQFVWNRKPPKEAKNVVAQIFGHEGKFESQYNYYCIDNSHRRQIGAILLPELQLQSENW